MRKKNLKSSRDKEFNPSSFESKWPRIKLTSSKRGAFVRGKQEDFNPGSFESKWQMVWKENRVYEPDLVNPQRKFYNLMMFPYPSAEGLHVGNMYAFTGADVYGRVKRMQGFDVFEPIGLDGFGIHSENYAIKIGKHPAEQAKISEKNFYRQLSQIGNGFAWEEHLETYDPDYYKWTQWLFVQMFKAGLAYRDKAMVNWCPSCKTVLADEQVEKKSSAQAVEVSVCERCKSEVERKEMSQWFFKITSYADQLLENLNKINWPAKIKTAQGNWIGKSEGLEVIFPIKDSDRSIEVFTTAHDTIFGVTFMVVAPEFAKTLLEIVPQEKQKIVSNYIEQSLTKTEQARKEGEKEKSGVDTGVKAINPFTDELVPVYVADYVLMGYGTGAVMGVPGHDARDHEFALKYNLPIRPVIKPTPKVTQRASVESDGFWNYEEIKSTFSKESVLFNSGMLDGLHNAHARIKIEEEAEKKGFGKKTAHYHLRDWLISRQRYWGPPIPMIYCQQCASKGESWFTSTEENKEVSRIKYPVSSMKTKIQNTKYTIQNTIPAQSAGWFPVPEDQLPVLLPDIKDFKPKGNGKSPLANAPDSWKWTSCPSCGGNAQRELDVSDTFLDSSWYFLMYPSVKVKNPKSQIPNPKQIQNSKSKTLEIGNWKLEIPWNREVTRSWLPVDTYIGGAEHAVLHLLYARFVWMCFRDWGYLPDGSAKGRSRSAGDEPFPFLFSHGLIIKDGAKMSKSRGNIVIPDEYINKYGADTLRCYLMFLGPYDQGGDFRDSGIAGMHRFLKRVWSLATIDSDVVLVEEHDSRQVYGAAHRAIKEITEDIEHFHYNTAIAHLMELVNLLKEKTKGNIRRAKGGMRCSEWDFAIRSLLLLLAPFAPHMTEELFQKLDEFRHAELVSASHKNHKEIPKQVRDDSVFRSIHKEQWPSYDPKMLVSDEVTIVVQVNGRLRSNLIVPVKQSKDQSAIEELARGDERVSKWLTGKMRKVVFVPGKLINFVV